MPRKHPSPLPVLNQSGSNLSTINPTLHAQNERLRKTILNAPRPKQRIHLGPFKKLPLELRQRIWAEVAQNGSRVVELSIRQARRSARAHGPTMIYTSSSLAPAILHVNSEARREGLKYYKKIERGGDGGGGTTYVNFNLDVVLVADNISALAAVRDVQIAQNMTKFAFGAKVARSGKLRPEMLAALPLLREVYVVDYEGEGDVMGRMELVEGVRTRLHTRNVSGLKGKVGELQGLVRDGVVGVLRDARYTLRNRAAEGNIEEIQVMQLIKEARELVTSNSLPNDIRAYDQSIGIPEEGQEEEDFDNLEEVEILDK